MFAFIYLLRVGRQADKTNDTVSSMGPGVSRAVTALSYRELQMVSLLFVYDYYSSCQLHIDSELPVQHYYLKGAEATSGT